MPFQMVDTNTFLLRAKAKPFATDEPHQSVPRLNQALWYTQLHQFVESRVQSPSGKTVKVAKYVLYDLECQFWYYATIFFMHFYLGIQRLA
jgi:hypothetical protein